MCDEYDDERMRAFWRMLANRDKPVVLPMQPAEEPLPLVIPLGEVGAEQKKAHLLAR